MTKEAPSWWGRVFGQGAPADWEDRVRAMQELLETQRAELVVLRQDAADTQALRAALAECQSHEKELYEAHESLRAELRQTTDDGNKWVERCRALEHAQRKHATTTQSLTRARDDARTAAEAARKQVRLYKLNLTDSKNTLADRDKREQMLKTQLKAAVDKNTALKTRSDTSAAKILAASDQSKKLAQRNAELERKVGEARLSTAAVSKQREEVNARSDQLARRQDSDQQQLNTLRGLTRMLTVFSAGQAALWGPAWALSLQTTANKCAQLRCMQSPIDWASALKATRLGELALPPGAPQEFNVRPELAAGGDTSTSQQVLQGVDRLITFFLQHNTPHKRGHTPSDTLNTPNRRGNTEPKAQL